MIMIMIHDDGKDDDKYLDAVVFFLGGVESASLWCPQLGPTALFSWTEH